MLDGGPPEGILVGAKPRPRLAGLNLSGDLASSIPPLFASSTMVSKLSELRLAEVDALVVGHTGTTNTSRGTQYIAWPDGDDLLPSGGGPPFVVAMCGAIQHEGRYLVIEQIGEPTRDKQVEIANAAHTVAAVRGDRRTAPSPRPVPVHYTGTVTAGLGSICTEFVIPRLNDLALERLVRETLVPACQARGRRPHTPIFSAAGSVELEPMLLGSDGQVLAGRYQRAGGEVWLLPADLGGVGHWIAAALRRWRQMQPERFADLPGWESDDRWRTARERAITVRIEELERNRRAAMDEFEAQESALRSELTHVAAEADAGARRLLTGEGDELVDAVADALRQLGFQVEDVDDTQRESADVLLEDLQVFDLEDPNWVALVEVRSYKGGAQLNDLMRLYRFERRFRDGSGRGASRLWYVVNQFRGRDAATSDRVPALPSHPAEVDEFAAAGGLIIDTTQLFDLVESTPEAGRVALRARMRAMTGRVQLPV